MLSHDDEVRAVTEVAQRLMEAFPGVPADLVQETVRTSHERFAGSPIRDFVPVLVERMTRTALADPAADRTPLAGSGTKDRSAGGRPGSFREELSR